MATEILPLGNGKVERRPRVRVIGVGGAGCNAISDSEHEGLAICAMVESARRPSRHDRLVIPRQQLDLMMTSPPRTAIALGQQWSRRLREEIDGADLVHIFSGLGGELGSHMTPLVAAVCQRPDNLVVSSVALPFSVEGKGRRDVAAAGLDRIISASDLTITYPNDQLMRIAPNLPLGRAFSVMDRIMMVPPRELGRVLTVDDLALVRDDFKDCSYLRFGYGQAQGHRRETIATHEAFASPWFDFRLEEVVSGIAVIFASDLDDVALREITSRISSRLPNARVRLAARADPELGDVIKVTLLLGVR